MAESFPRDRSAATIKKGKPPCRYGASCTSKSCRFDHSSSGSVREGTHASTKHRGIEANKEPWESKPVIDCLEHLVIRTAGEFSAAKLAILYAMHPEASKEIKSAGGVKGFCALHPSRVRFIPNAGAGTVTLVPADEVALGQAEGQPSNIPSTKRKPCRYGAKCTTRNCKFEHPPLAYGVLEVDTNCGGGAAAFSSEETILRNLSHETEAPNQASFLAQVEAVLLARGGSVAAAQLMPLLPDSLRDGIKSAGGVKAFCEEQSGRLHYEVAKGRVWLVRAFTKAQEEGGNQDCATLQQGVVGGGGRGGGEILTERVRVPCRFGARCKASNCKFFHPDGARADTGKARERASAAEAARRESQAVAPALAPAQEQGAYAVMLVELLLDLGDGEVTVGKLQALHGLYPEILASVRAAGGVQAFCAMHPTRMRYVEDATKHGGGMLVRVPAQKRSSTDELRQGQGSTTDLQSQAVASSSNVATDMASLSASSHLLNPALAGVGGFCANAQTQGQVGSLEIAPLHSAPNQSDPTGMHRPFSHAREHLRQPTPQNNDMQPPLPPPLPQQQQAASGSVPQPPLSIPADSPMALILNASELSVSELAAIGVTDPTEQAKILGVPPALSANAAPAMASAAMAGDAREISVADLEAIGVLDPAEQAKILGQPLAPPPFVPPSAGGGAAMSKVSTMPVEDRREQQRPAGGVSEDKPKRVPVQPQREVERGISTGFAAKTEAGAGKGPGQAGGKKLSAAQKHERVLAKKKELHRQEKAIVQVRQQALAAWVELWGRPASVLRRKMVAKRARDQLAVGWAAWIEWLGEPEQQQRVEERRREREEAEEEEREREAGQRQVQQALREQEREAEKRAKEERKAKKQERRHKDKEEAESRRLNFWQEEQRHEITVTQRLVDMCVADFARKCLASKEPAGSIEQSLLANQRAMNRLYAGCLQLYRKLYQHRICRPVTLVGLKGDLENRTGTIKCWDEDKEKFHVRLDTKKGHSNTAMFVRPGNLEPVTGRPLPPAKSNRVRLQIETLHLDLDFAMVVEMAEVEALVAAADPRGYVAELMRKRDVADRERREREAQERRVAQERWEQEERRRREARERAARAEAERQRVYEERRREQEAQWREFQRYHQQQQQQQKKGRPGGCNCGNPRCPYNAPGRAGSGPFFGPGAQFFNFGFGFSGMPFGGGYEFEFEEAGWSGSDDDDDDDGWEYFGGWGQRDEGARAAAAKKREAEDARHAAVLGVSPDASRDQIKAAYRAKALQLHPDKCAAHGLSEAEATDKFKSLQAAYEHLMSY